MKYKYRNRSFWCRGYYVDTVGKNTMKISEYIQNQLREYEMSEQLTQILKTRLRVTSVRMQKSDRIVALGSAATS